MAHILLLHSAIGLRPAVLEFADGSTANADLVIGADGLHSGVRQLTFGDQAREVFLGGYLAVVSVPTRPMATIASQAASMSPRCQAAAISGGRRFRILTCFGSTPSWARAASRLAVRWSAVKPLKCLACMKAKITTWQVSV